MYHCPSKRAQLWKQTTNPQNPGHDGSHHVRFDPLNNHVKIQHMENLKAKTSMIIYMTSLSYLYFFI